MDLFVFWVVFVIILFLAIVAAARCIQLPHNSLAFLSLGLFAIAIPLAIPGYEVSVAHNGTVIKTKYERPIISWFHPYERTTVETTNTSNNVKRERINITSAGPIKSLSKIEGREPTKVSGDIGSNSITFDVILDAGETQKMVILSSDTVSVVGMDSVTIDPPN